ncbi:MAG: helix-turn-helix domain-containing protein [Polyangiaceae bacterium]
MARPVVIRDAQILEAARAVFLEQGARATTAEVARRAGVAEGSVFKRFGTKDNLFAKAMLGPTGAPPWLATLHAQSERGDPRATLEEVGIEAIGFFQTMLPVLMMAWSNPSPSGLPSILASDDPPPVIALRALTRFFAAEERAGRIRRCDPHVAARTYLGGLVQYVFLDIVIGRGKSEPPSPEKHVRGLVDLLFEGLAPRAKSHRPRRPRE